MKSAEVYFGGTGIAPPSPRHPPAAAPARSPPTPPAYAARILVPVRRQKGNGLVPQQPDQRLRNRHIRPPLPQPQHRDKIRIPGDLVSQLPHTPRHRPPLPIKPEPPLFKPIQQPLPKRPLLLFLPGFREPASLIFRPLQQTYRRVGSDLMQSSLHKLPVCSRPVCRDLLDRRRSVPGEPRRLLIACFNGPSQRNLKRPLPKREPRKVISAVSQILFGKPVQPVTLPVHFFLHSNHPHPQRHACGPRRDLAPSHLVFSRKGRLPDLVLRSSVLACQVRDRALAARSVGAGSPVASY